MKKVISILILSMFGLSAQSYAHTSELTVYRFTQILSPQVASQIPQSIRKLRVENFRASKEEISFKIKSFSFHIKWVGSDKMLLTVNGKSFSKTELSSRSLILKNLNRKLGVKTFEALILELFINEAKAQQFLPFSPLPQEKSHFAMPLLAFSPYSLGSVTQNNNPQNMTDFLSCLMGSCFKQGFMALSFMLDGLMQFGTNDRAFNQFMAVPKAPKAPQFGSSSY